VLNGSGVYIAKDIMNGASKIKIDVAKLSEGMYVCELDRPWLETPFLTQGFPLRNENDIASLRRHCKFVFVDVGRSDSAAVFQMGEKPSIAIAPAAPIDDAKPRKNIFSRLFGENKRGSISNDVVRPVRAAAPTLRDTRDLVRTVFDDVRLGRAVDAMQAKEVVSKCVDQVIEHPDAMVLLTSIKNKDEYTAEHSINVSILSIILGKQIGLERKALEEVGACGLLHDVGKILSPDQILKKPDRLTPEELLIMKMHPSQGRDILMGSNGVLKSAIDTAHGHHEKLDGTGYPRGLNEAQLGLYTKIVGVVDTYDAITSDRAYDAGRSNIEAYKILQSQGGNHYDSELVSHLINAIGVYPPGTVVQLNSGEIGVVVRSSPTKKLQPKLLILKTADLKPLVPRYVDLAATNDKRASGLRIAKQLRAADVGIDSQIFRSNEFLASL
jgi:HD-GYP domain-containing protein (c-di-GMP phosphodiesterase class II)